LTLENGPENLSRNIGDNYHPTRSNIQEERSPRLRCGGGLKSRKEKFPQRRVFIAGFRSQRPGFKPRIFHVAFFVGTVV